MFEKLIVDLINRALGDYVENLDASQLNLSIWRGDVRLENLNIKPNALEGLEIPIEVKQGHLGSLVLRIPWKNLYTEPTVAEVNGLYILAVPIFGMKFDPEKERRFNFETKMKRVRQFEEDRAKAALAAGTKETVDLGFAEKMVLQVIKNLQVRIKNVHIRYEDRVTCPDYPFTTGVCLESFSFQTTTADWTPTTVKENVTELFHKLLDLKSLSVYYNSLSNMSPAKLKEDFYSELSVAESNRAKVRQMLEEKMSHVFSQRRPNLQYIIQPISARAKFRYEAFPEMNGYKSPQIWLDLDFNELSLEFSKSQYTTLVLFGDSIDRIVTMNKYRKYRIRPGNERLNAREKWQFSYKVISSEVVRRRRNMWSWQRIKSHRLACRAYTELYKKKLKSEKFDTATLERYEFDLDAFNIIMCRQRAENLVKKDRSAKKKQGSSTTSGGGGWFGGWFGGGSKDAEQKKKDAGTASSGQTGSSLFDSAKAEFERMSEEERAQLYSVVNYKENAPQASSYPRDYRARSMQFNLTSLSFLLHDRGRQILRFQLKGVKSSVGQYPSSECAMIQADVGSVSLWGSCSSNSGSGGATELSFSMSSGIGSSIRTSETPSEPCLIRTLEDDSSGRGYLFRLNLDINPFDALPDQHENKQEDNQQQQEALVVGNRIKLVANPVEIVYDADTVIKIVDFLEPSEEIKFRELSAVLSNQLESVKGMTATGLKHMIEQRSYTDISVDLKPSHFILPETGRYHSSDGTSKRLLVFDFGELCIRTEPPPDISQLDAHINATTRVLDFEKMRSVAYDCLRVRLSSMQLLFADRGENWCQFRQVSESRAHLVRPLALEFDLYKCMVATDPRLPKVKIVGQLPSLVLEVNEQRARQLLELVGGIQFPSNKGKTSALASPTVNVTSGAQPATTSSSSTADNAAGLRLSKLQDVLDPKFRPSDSIDLGSVVSEEDDDENDEFQDAVETQPAESAALSGALGASPGLSGSVGQGSTGRSKRVFNLIEGDIRFEICTVVVSLTKAVENPPAARFLEFQASHLSLQLVKRTFDLRVKFCLDSVALLHHEFSDPHNPNNPLEILSSELQSHEDQRGSSCAHTSRASVYSTSVSEHSLISDGSDLEDGHLVQLNYVNVERNSPFLATQFANALQSMDVGLQTLKVKLHKESLLGIFEFVQTLLPLLEAFAAKGNSETSPTEVQAKGTAAQQQSLDRHQQQIRAATGVISNRSLPSSSASSTVGPAGAGPASSTLAASDVNLTDMQFNVRCAAVQLYVCQKENEIMRAHVSGLSVGSKLTRTATCLSVVLQQLEVKSRLNGELYDTVIWVSQKQVFELDLTVFNLPLPAAQLSSDAVDMSVSAKLAKINCVFLHSFVVQLLHFLDSFQTAKAQIAQGTQMLTQSAKEKAVQSSNLKMQLDVEIQAPVILVPESSASSNVLWVDLGCIRVYNNFNRVSVAERASLAASGTPLPLSESSTKFLDQWQMHNVRNSSSTTADSMATGTTGSVIDTEIMQIELFDVKVIRSTVVKGDDDQLKPESEVQVMEPFELKAQLRRHYSSEPVYLPTLAVNASIGKIDLRLAQADYHSIVRIFIRNLNEGKQLQSSLSAAIPPATQQQQQQGQEQQQVQVNQLSTVMTVEAMPDSPKKKAGGTSPPKQLLKVAADVSTSEPSTSVAAIASETADCGQSGTSSESTLNLTTCSVQFQFQVASISLALYHDEAERVAKVALGRAQVKQFVLGGHLMSDGLTRVLMQLGDLKLTDRRPGAEHKINKILHKREELFEATRQKEQSDGPTNPLLLMTITSEKDGNQLMDVNVASVYLCVDMGYLKELADFFSPPDLESANQSIKPMPQPQPIQRPPKADMESSGTADTASVRTSDEGIASSDHGGRSSSVGNGGALLTLRVRVSEPQLLLVEDLSDPSCNAVVLNLKASVDFRRNSSVEHCNIGVEKLQLFCCPFNEMKRRSSYIEVISPCDMSVMYHSEVDPLNCNVPQKQKMAVTFESIFVNISPPVIQTLVRISSVLTSAQVQESKNANENPTEPSVYPDGLWRVKPIANENLPFLNADTSSPEGATSAEQGFDVGAALDEIEQRRKQEMQVSLNQIKLIFNIEVGPKTVPMLILESKVTGVMTNWSANSELTLNIDAEMAYYNEAHDFWEPFLEPVDQQPPRPFQLVFQFIMNEDFVLVDLETQNMPLVQPKTVISVSSMDPLELTLTRTSLAMLTTLSQEFNEAYNLGSRPKKEAEAAFVIENCLGELLMVCLSEQLASRMRCVNTNSSAASGIQSFEAVPPAEIPLREGEKLRLDERSRMVARSSVRELQEYEADPVQIGYRLPRLSIARQAVFRGSETRAFTVPLPTYPEPSGCRVLLVSQARCYLGTKTLHVRSNVSLRNESALQITVTTRAPDGTVAWSTELEPVTATPSADNATTTTGKGAGATTTCAAACHLPLSQAAEARGQVYFSCNGQPSKPVAWYIDASHTLSFSHPNYPDLVTTFNVLVRTKKVYLESDGDNKNASDYLLVIVPSYTVVNQLPCNLQMLVPGDDEPKTIERGESFPLYNVPHVNTPFVTLLLSEYMELEWRANLLLSKTADRPEDQIYGITFESAMGVYDKQEMLLSCRLLDQQSTKNFTILSTYWLVNKTGKELHYKSPDNRLWRHPAKCNLTFMNLSANFSSKEKICLKVEDSGWSSRFPLDTVGHAGTVKCKADSINYQVGVNISVGSNGITKIVTFIPFFSIVNKSPMRLEISECIQSKTSYHSLTDPTPFTTVPCWEATPFWPICDIEKKKMTMQVRVNESEVTEPFPITDSCASMLRLTADCAKYGGVLAEVAFAQEACVVTLQQYQPGFAPLRLVNALPQEARFPPIHLQQKGVEQERQLELASGTCLLYSWPDPKQERVLEWSCGQMRAQCRTVDGYEKGSPCGAKIDESSPDSLLYAVCFLSGCQRVLLFTNDCNLACSARLATMFERVDSEFKVSLMSIGLSLVDNKRSSEVAYLSLRSPGVQWYETRKSGLLKPMKKGLSDALEIIFNRYVQQVELKKNPQTRVLERANDTEIEIDFGVQPFMLKKPKNCPVERQLDPALFFSFKSSPHNMTLAVKLAKLQIDSMLPSGMYQIFFYQVPPPKSVAVDQVPKAFVDASIVIRRLENDVMQVQYCKVLVQEMEVKLDQVFLNGLLDMISVLVTPSSQETRENFLTDCSFVEASLVSEQLANLSDSGKKHFIDQLHLSPIKINLSFSLSSSDNTSNPFVGLAIATVLGSVARCSDVLLQLSCLHRENMAYSSTQLLAEVKRHYIRQFVGQLYKVFLSIDLIGNPLSVIGGLRSGAQDFFYEPIAGAIQGPEEFVEGMYSGMKSFVGHTVGGVSGFLQRMTGTVGHLAAIASFDSKYQQKREAHIRSRGNYGTGSNMAKAAQNLGLGFVQGISGIVTQPIEGVREGGAVGLISGFGKGLVGVVSRPVGAVVDFASDTFYTVQRVADLSEVPRRVRDPRYIRPESRLVYYRRQEASGYTVLQQAVKPIPKEVYCIHCLVNDTKSRAPVAALVTNFRFLLARRADILGTWSCDTQYTWDQIEEVKETRTGFELVLKTKKRKSILGGLRGASNETCGVNTAPDAARKMVSVIKIQMRETEQKIGTSECRSAV